MRLPARKLIVAVAVAVVHVSLYSSFLWPSPGRPSQPSLKAGQDGQLQAAVGANIAAALPDSVHAPVAVPLPNLTLPRRAPSPSPARESLQCPTASVFGNASLPHPRTVLYSFEGSGNTWVRQLLERATGTLLAYRPLVQPCCAHCPVPFKRACARARAASVACVTRACRGGQFHSSVYVPAVVCDHPQACTLARCTLTRLCTAWVCTAKASRTGRSWPSSPTTHAAWRTRRPRHSSN